MPEQVTDDGISERGFGGEMVEERGFAYAHVVGDRLQGGALESLPGHASHRRLQELSASGLAGAGLRHALDPTTW